jgi:hypothetical protein
MQDKLLIATRVKKTIEYIEKVLINCPQCENILKNKIIISCYELLELVYKANVFKETVYMKEIIVKIRIIEYYIKSSLDKKILSFKKYEIIGNHLLEINKMINSWIKYEKNR